MRCPNCSKSTLRKAKFCHNCGQSLTGHQNKSPNKAQFQTTIPDTVVTVGPNQVTKMEMVTTVGLIWSLSLGGCWLAEINPAWSVLPGLGTLIAPTIANAAYQWRTLPKPPREHINKIQVEHVDQYHRPRSIYDFEESITMDHLQHVAKRITDGEPFSRRGICQPGQFSQGDYYKIRDEFLRLNYAFYKNPAVKNEGIVLTPRCQKLLKRVVNGG